jgi:hypothetical protein
VFVTTWPLGSVDSDCRCHTLWWGPASTAWYCVGLGTTDEVWAASCPKATATDDVKKKSSDPGIFISEEKRRDLSIPMKTPVAQPPLPQLAHFQFQPSEIFS